MEEDRKNKKLILTPKQRDIYNQIKGLVETGSNSIYLPADYPARDRVFIQNLTKALVIHQSTLEDEENKYLYIEYDSEEELKEEKFVMRKKVFEEYEAAEVIEEDDIETYEEKVRQKEEKNFIEWKRQYYKEKMNIDYDDSEQMENIIGSYIEGLQWVLHYYYAGVASWGWFYPYHYAPKISDLCELDRFDIRFDMGQPFTPFEQLMGVLPELSKKFLPQPYQDLMTNSDSPIIDFYPNEFNFDMNGKKQDWEAIVLIPFIDQKRLIAALKDRKDQLTEEERQRDTFGDSLLFTHDSSLNFKYSSSLPGFFTDICHCQCRKEIYELPTLKGLRLIKGLCDGVQLGVKAMAGFPSLQTLRHTAKLLQHGVNVFNSESKNETMVITIDNKFKDMKVEDVAREKIGKRIFVGWPFLQEGIVQALSDELFRYELSNGQTQVVKNPHRPEVLDQWLRKADRIEHTYNKRHGTITGSVELLAHVLMLKGMKRVQDGALIKEYGEEQDHAIQTTVDNVECEDSRYEEKPPVPLTEEFPICDNIFYLGHPYYGCPGIVISNIEKNLAVKLVYDREFIDKEPEFGSEIAKTFSTRIKYTPWFKVAPKLGISGLTLSKLTASLHVICKAAEHKSGDQKSNDQRINLGLNLKFESKKQKVLGYTRKTRIKDKDGWEYSEKAINLLEEYKKKFPEFIQALESKHSKDEIYTAEDFYPKEEAVSKINAIKDWLRTVEVRDFEKVSLEAEQLDKEAVKDIEKAADKLLNRQLEKKEIEKLARHQLLKPSHATTLLQNQKFSLGDRVVFVKDSGNVPIASKGTIVGIEKSNIDVVFDTTFMGGSPLGDRCSNYRGMIVPANSLLNLTKPQLDQLDQLDRRSNIGNSRSRHGANSNYQSRSHQETVHNGQQMYNSYPYYSNAYQYRGNRGGGHMHSANHTTNGSHQRQSNRPRGASGSNGYIQSSHLHHNQIQIRPRPIQQSQASSAATKYGIQNQTHHAYRNSRGSNGNGYLNRGGYGSRGHYGGNGISRGRGRADGKT